MNIEGSWNRLTMDIRGCLIQRFPDCPGAIIEGMVIEILHKVVPFTSDIIKARDEAWEDCIKERFRKVQPPKEAEWNPLEHPERYLDDTMAIVDDMTMAQRRELLKYLENKIEGNKKENS